MHPCTETTINKTIPQVRDALIFLMGHVVYACVLGLSLNTYLREVRRVVPLLDTNVSLIWQLITVISDVH